MSVIPAFCQNPDSDLRKTAWSSQQCGRKKVRRWGMQLQLEGREQLDGTAGRGGGKLLQEIAQEQLGYTRLPGHFANGVLC